MKLESEVPSSSIVFTLGGCNEVASPVCDKSGNTESELNPV